MYHRCCDANMGFNELTTGARAKCEDFSITEYNKLSSSVMAAGTIGRIKMKIRDYRTASVILE